MIMIENVFIASLLIFVATTFVIWTKIHDIGEKVKLFGGALLLFSSIGMLSSGLIWMWS